MSKVIYLPLEHEPMRYTAALDASILHHLKSTGQDFVRIYPKDVMHTDTLPQGCFLDAQFTIQFKMAQLRKLAELWANLVSDGDTIFLSDIWMPGVESIRYLEHFTKKRVKLHGILHAGSFTDTDEVRKLERWAGPFETMLLDIFDKVIVGSRFMADEVMQKRIVDPRKLHVSPFPLDPDLLAPHTKENIVVFNGRLHPEKQPELFDLLKERCNVPKDTVWLNTAQERLAKPQYHAALGLAKCVVSFALQENFGFGIAEATMSGCIPVVPNRLVYPEFYPSSCLYRNLTEAQSLVEQALWEYDPERQAGIKSHLMTRIRPDLTGWF
jgi:glycosyltransferase involved in cell wall biosynthesis